jgi:PAS domain S-box-containing protein
MADASVPRGGLSRCESSEAKASILLVDDNPANLLSLRAILEELGQDLVEARSGEEALERAQAGEFAVVLLDVLMPGIGGFETARRLRADPRARHTPVIFLTAADIDRAQFEEGYALGAVDFLVKPFLPIVLRAKVRGFIELFLDKQQARREADLLRLLVEGAKDYAIFLLDPDGRVASWNPGAERIKGYRAEEIIGQHFSRFYPQEALDRGWPDYELRVARAEGRFEDEGWRLRKDGSRFWANVVITALRDQAGNLRGFSKITRDMTERKRAEESARRLVEETTARRVAEENARLIQEQRERLHVTLTSIGDAVISTDAEGRVDFLNPVAERLVGWTVQEAAHRTLGEVFRIVNEWTRQPVENPALRALESGTVVGLANHTVLISRDGSERPIDDSAAPIRDAQSNVVGSVLVFRDISERRLAQQRLREQQELLRVTLASIGDAVIATDTQGHVTFLNPVAEALTGWLQAEAQGQPLEAVFAILDERTQQPSEHPVARVLREGKVVGLGNHTVLVARDGAQRPIEDSAAPIRDATGQSVGVVLIFRDVTEERRARAELRNQEQRFRQLADAMPQIVWSAGPEGNIDYLNRRWTDFTGLAQTVGNQGWATLLHPDEAPTAAERWAASLRSGDRFEMELRLFDRREQQYRWHLIRTVAARDAEGKVVRWIGTSTDIHEQKRAAESAHYLAEASAALAVVVDYKSTLQKVANLAVPYFADWSAVDVAEDDTLRRLAVAHQNPEKVELAHALARHYPISLEAKGGIGAVFRTGKPEILTDLPDALLAQGARDERHLQLLRGLGLKSYICVPLVVAGNTLGVLTFATAESGRRYTHADLALAMDLANRAAVAVENTRLYQALRDTDRRKDEFLATLAHELRNPLAPIRNSLQILKMPHVDAETVERSRDMMERQLQHLVRLVDDLLDVSRVMRGKIELRKERVELAAVVARAVETVQAQMDSQHHELSVRLPPDSLPVDADPVRLAQVVGNLLTNAAKYTEPGGRIALTAERNGTTAILRVRDTGIGIAADMLPRIFELFVQVDPAATRAQGGLGIGLTLVKNLVEMHHGTIEARSAGLGQGSEFIVRLPLATQESAEEQAPEAGPPVHETPAPTGLHVLVVDDNQDAANSLAMLLRLQGHEVRVAYTGVTALEMAKGQAPDVVFLDIGMPGMDGYEVARRLRQQPGLENVVLAALTGWGQQEDRRRSARAGFRHHFVKPPEPKVVEEVLAQLKRPAP